MGAEKYQRKVLELFARSPVVQYKSIERVVLQQKKVKPYIKQLVRNLLRQKKIRRLTKGYYTRHDDSSLAIFCFQPGYFGLQEALSYHGLWEQETIPIILTARKVRTGIRMVLGGKVLIRHIDKKYYFGVEYRQENNLVFPYSDLEKTLIDLVHFKQKINPEAVCEFQKMIDKLTLKRYLQKYPLKTKEKTLKIMKESAIAT